MKIPVSPGRVGSGHRRSSVILAIGAAVLLVSPGAAQSPSPSAPAASTAPGASVAPSPGATTLSPLQAMVAASAAQVCDPFLTAAEVGSITGFTVTRVGGGHVQKERNGFIKLECTWSLDAGTADLPDLRVVSLEVSDLKVKGKPKAKDLVAAMEFSFNPEATKLAGLGDIAYSDPGFDFGRYPGRPNVAWAIPIKHGKAYADREFHLLDELGSASRAPKLPLEDLARVVRSDATPGAAPAAAAPGDAAAPLLGSWTLTDVQGLYLSEEPPTTTLTFDDMGVATTRFDCKGHDRKKLAPITLLYLIDGDRMALVDAGEGGSGLCFGKEPFPILVPAQLAQGLAGLIDATWTVDGDTLTIAGTYSGWTFERATS